MLANDTKVLFVIRDLLEKIVLRVCVSSNDRSSQRSELARFATMEKYLRDKTQSVAEIFEEYLFEHENEEQLVANLRDEVAILYGTAHWVMLRDALKTIREHMQKG